MSVSDSEKYEIEILAAENYKLWDDFVTAHPFGWVTHLSRWKNVVEKSFPHVKGKFLVLKKDEKIVAGLPVYSAKSWLMGNRLISIPFATISDPLVSDAQQAELLLKNALQFADEAKIEIVQIRAMGAATFLSEVKIPTTIDDSFKQHYILLDNNLDELKLSFNKRNVRKRIRQSLEKGLSHKLVREKSEVEEFYHIYLKTRKRLGLPPLPVKFLFNLWDEFAASGNFHLILAQKENRTLGGISFFQFKDRVNAEIIAYEAMYRDLYLSQYLYWQAIIFAKEQNCRIFDLGRTSVFNEGLMNYKNHWGTEIRDLPIYYFSQTEKTAKKTREKSPTYNIIRAVGKRLPTPLFELYGNFFYHHSA